MGREDNIHPSICSRAAANSAAVACRVRWIVGAGFGSVSEFDKDVITALTTLW